MREAARATREETTAGCAPMRPPASRDSLRERLRGAALRKRADDDALGIREWSKAEIARIRDEAEKRIADRRAELARETDAHASGIERLVEQVQEVATTFEAEMEQFFEFLLAEQDPARLATLAEQVPDAPVFDALPPLKRAAARTAATAPPASRPRRASRLPRRSPQTRPTQPKQRAVTLPRPASSRMPPPRPRLRRSPIWTTSRQAARTGQRAASPRSRRASR